MIQKESNTSIFLFIKKDYFSEFGSG